MNRIDVQESLTKVSSSATLGDTIPFPFLTALFIRTPTKRYEEVDGVRKEKERLTTDQSTSTSYLSFPPLGEI